MGAHGRAFTLVTPEEGKELTEVEKLINKEIHPYVPDGFQPSIASARRQTEAPPESEPAVSSRYAQPVQDPSDATAVAPPPPRTLGGRFRPARRRR
jgi:superfamily II DNA/RNA helicase